MTHTIMIDSKSKGFNVCTGATKMHMLWPIDSIQAFIIMNQMIPVSFFMICLDLFSRLKGVLKKSYFDGKWVSNELSIH